MSVHIQSVDMDVWNAVVNGRFQLQVVANGDKPKSDWSGDDKKKVQYDLKAHNILISSLGVNEYCHTPIFDLRSYIHIPSDPEYYLTFQNKNSAERYFKIPHFCSDSDPLLS